MAENKPTQKQISQRYDGAADYPRRPHYFRRLRGWLFAVAAVASILGALAFAYLGRQNAYSPGPISENHARFDCRVCHVNGKTDAVPSSSSLSHMDQACLKCHP